MPVGTGISAQQGMLSISETKRNHMGQGLGNRGGGGGGGRGGGGGVRQNSYFFFLQKQKRRNYCGGMSWGHCHVEDGHV